MPYKIGIALLTQKQLPFEGKILFDRIPADQGIEMGLVST